MTLTPKSFKNNLIRLQHISDLMDLKYFTFPFQEPSWLVRLFRRFRPVENKWTFKFGEHIYIPGQRVVIEHQCGRSIACWHDWNIEQTFQCPNCQMKAPKEILMQAKLLLG